MYPSEFLASYGDKEYIDKILKVGSSTEVGAALKNSPYVNVEHIEHLLHKRPGHVSRILDSPLHTSDHLHHIIDNHLNDGGWVAGQVVRSPKFNKDHHDKMMKHVDELSPGARWSLYTSKHVSKDEIAKGSHDPDDRIAQAVTNYHATNKLM